MTDAGGSKLLVVYLSDLHIKDSNSKACLRIEQIAGAIGNLGGSDVHLVISITGDIAFSGTAPQYKAAKTALDTLKKKLADWKFASIRCHCSPGNHDCDFTRISAGVHEALFEGICEDHQKLSGIVAELLRLQTAFNEFRTSFDESRKINDILSVAEIREKGLSVDLLMVNTAWSSRLNEQPGTLRMPAEILPVVPQSADLTFGLLHHPLNWFTPPDGKALSEWLDCSVDVALWGHEHRHDDFAISRKTYGSSVAYFLALPVDDESTKCGFKTLLVSPSANDILISSFEWHGRKVVQVDSESRQLPRNPARAIGQIRHSRKFREFLEDVGAALQHPRLSRPITLGEIFVAPEFKAFESDKGDLLKTGSATSFSSTVEKILEEPISFVYGAEQSGKTSLAKKLIADIRHRGLTGIYLDCSKLRSLNQGEITAWIEKEIQDQFEADCIGDVKYLPPQEKVVVIDSLEKVPGSFEGAEVVLERCGVLARHSLALTANNPAISLLATAGGTSESFFNKGKWYELLPLGHKRRAEVVRRWTSLGRDLRLDRDKIESETRQIKNLLDNTLGRTFMPKFPFFLLLLLQQIEGLKDNRTVITNGTQGYLLEALITRSMDGKVKTHAIGLTYDFLARLAFDLWSRKEDTLSESGQKTLAVEFRQGKLVAIRIDELIDELCEAKVLTRTPEGVSFKYEYLYYYFLARWLTNNSEGEAGKALMADLIKYVYTERSANVLMFVAHAGKEIWVLSQILPLAKALYSGKNECDLAERASLAARFNDKEQRHVLMLGDSASVTDHYQESQDEYEARVDGSVDRDEDAFQFNTSLRVMQLLGQILRSRAGVVGGIEKLEIAKETIGLSRRLMTVLYDAIEESADELAESASETFKNRLRLNASDAVAIANRLVGTVVVGIASLLVGKAADALGSSDLTPLIEEIETRNVDDLNVRLFMVVARLGTEKGYPKELINDFIKELRPGDILTHNALAAAVARSFYYQLPPRGVREAACVRLGIQVKALPGLRG